MKCKSEIKIYPDGMHEMDPCIYEDVAIYRNVTIYISKCKVCGHVEISWEKQDDTEEIE